MVTYPNPNEMEATLLLTTRWMPILIERPNPNPSLILTLTITNPNYKVNANSNRKRRSKDTKMESERATPRKRHIYPEREKGTEIGKGGERTTMRDQGEIVKRGETVSRGRESNKWQRKGEEGQRERQRGERRCQR